MIRIFELKPSTFLGDTRVLMLELYEEDGSKSYSSYTFDSNKVITINTYWQKDTNNYLVDIVFLGTTIGLTDVKEDFLVRLRGTIWRA